jgi:hypothetical protein
MPHARLKPSRYARPPHATYQTDVTYLTYPTYVTYLPHLPWSSSVTLALGAT